MKVVVAGRRSGKDEVGTKRGGILQAVTDTRYQDGRTAFCAPTQDQAKDIFWDDLKLMTPDWAVRDVRESYPQTITLKTGYRMEVRGLDKPARIEGKPLDDIRVTEVDDLKGLWVFDAHILPALGTTGRPGTGTFVGVPEGKTILWELRKRALKDPEWAYFEWLSEDVLLPEELDFFRRTMDPDTFDREFRASFRNYEGRAYYPFDWAVHAVERLAYDPTLPLVICFDFNVAPGVAVVLQEQAYRGRRPEIWPTITAVIGEVHIPNNSTTEAVCRKLVEDWGQHAGPVYCYGDASGGARGSAKVAGSDWEIIGGSGGVLRRHFGARLSLRVQAQNPPVKARVNAVNRRLQTADGKVRILFDPDLAPHVCECLDGVLLLKGGAFEIDKRKCEAAGLTHWSDALGYYLHAKFGLSPEAAAAEIRPLR